MLRSLTEVIEERAATAQRSFIEAIEYDAPRSLPGVFEEARRWAARLHDLGVRRGDRVALLMESRVRTVEALLGAWMLRAAVVPLAPPRGLVAAPRSLERISAALRSSGAKVLLANPKALGRLPGDAVKALGVTAVPLDEPGTAQRAPDRGEPADLALVQFTSGSTGRPRGVAISQANLLANVSAIVAALRLTPEDRCVDWLPLFHDMGLVGTVLVPLLAGASAVLIAPEAFVLRPAVWLETFTSRAGTFAPAPNFGYQLCVNRVADEVLERLDLHSWRVALNGAEPVRIETVQAFTARFAPRGFRAEAFLPVYGLAESTLAVAFPPLERLARVEVVDPEALRATGRAVRAAPGSGRSLVSVGSAFPGAELRIVDGEGRPVGERTEGEVVLRGPSVTSGYLGDPDATARTLRDGWLHTGDLGFVAEGELFVTGRLKSVLIRAGEKYHAEDLERAAERVPDVRQGCSAAFAVDAQGGEDVVLVVERAARAKGDPTALAREVSQEVLRSEGITLGAVHVVAPGQVPKTSSGKIQRERCRDALGAGVLEVVASLVRSDEGGG